MSVQIQQGIQSYFSENLTSSAMDHLRWWAVNGDQFPLLSKVAQVILCVPGTSAPSETEFSAAGHIVNKLCAALTPENIDAVIFLQQNHLLKAQTAMVSAALPPVAAPEGPNRQVDLPEVLDEEVSNPDLPSL